MPAPILVSQSGSTWTDLVNTDEVTGSISWSAGDLILVVGFTEDQTITLGTPTAAGLAFSDLGSPITTGSSCWAHTWTATAGSGGSGAVTGPRLVGTGTANRGIWAFVYSGHSGTGTRAAPAASSAQTVSLARAGNNSAVVFVSADWTASGVAGIGWTPAGQTQLQAADAVNCEAFLAHWGDQGSAGTTSYGTTGLAGTQFSKIAVEILGSTTANDYAGPYTGPTPGRLGPTGEWSVQASAEQDPFAEPPAPLVIAAPRPAAPGVVLLGRSVDTPAAASDACPPIPIVVAVPVRPADGHAFTTLTPAAPEPPVPLAIVVAPPTRPLDGHAFTTLTSASPDSPVPLAVVVAAPTPPRPGRAIALASLSDTPVTDTPPAPQAVVVAAPAPPRPGRAIALASLSDTPTTDTPPVPQAVVEAAPRPPSGGSAMVRWSQAVTPLQPSDSPPIPVVIARPAVPRPGLARTYAAPAEQAATVERPPSAVIVVAPLDRRAGFSLVWIGEPAPDPIPPRATIVAAPARRPSSAPVVVWGRADPPVVVPGTQRPITLVVTPQDSPRRGVLWHWAATLHNCFAIRPDTGVVTWGGSTLTRPDTGLTARPGSGTVARPFTGVVENDC